MKLILYDFDKTIYNGDSSFDFFIYCLKKKTLIIIYVPKMFIAILLYKLKIINKKRMKEMVFSFLKIINDVDCYVEDFWKCNNIKIKEFYRKKNHGNDIIMSASPEFLLKPLTKQYKVKDLFATIMDKSTGQIDGENCYGKEKVRRFMKKYDVNNIYEAYSDSYSDTPMLKLAKNSYIVSKEKITKVYFNKKNNKTINK